MIHIPARRSAVAVLREASVVVLQECCKGNRFVVPRGVFAERCIVRSVHEKGEVYAMPSSGRAVP